MQPLPLIVAGILFLLGFIGTFVPVLPGAALIWLGMLLYGFLTGFANLPLDFYLLQGLAAILVMAVDYVATAWGTKRFGGTRRAAWGAALGLFLGIVFLGPGGIIFGPFLGAFLGEVIGGLPANRAIRSSFGALIGLVGGLFLKVGIELVMVIWFFRAIFGVT